MRLQLREHGQPGLCHTRHIPGLGVTSLPGLIFWFVSLSMSLSSPPGLSLFMSLTPSLLFPRPRLVPFPAPCCVPRPPLPPSCWNHQSPLHPPAPVSSSPATSGKPVEAVWAKPPATRTHYPRQAPRDSLPSDTPTPPFSSCPLSSDLPFPSVLVPAPSPPHSCPPPATSLPADSPPISPHPCYHHDTHSTSGPGRSRSPSTPLRPKKRAASISSHVAHGTVPGSWTGSQLVSALHSIFGCDFHLQRMQGSGLHRQVKVLWRNHRLAVNIWGTGRVHVQGKGASHFAQLLLSVKDPFFAQRFSAPTVAGPF